jgi:wobble nucleotide-excising tRNase
MAMIRRINKLKNVGRFVELASQSGNQGEFDKLSIIYASNAGGKTTLCDVFRSLGENKPEYVAGRKRLGSTSPIEIEILLPGSPSAKASFHNGNWTIDPVGTSVPGVLIYDDRFVADNVLIGQYVAVEQRRKLYGLVMGSQAIAMKRRVDQAEQELSSATSALSGADAQLKALIPFGWAIETLRPLAKEEAIDTVISEASNELDAAKRTKQNADAIRARKALRSVDPPAIPNQVQAILDTTLDDIALQAEAEIKKHLAEHANDLGLDWVRLGNDNQKGTTYLGSPGFPSHPQFCAAI